MDRPEGRGPFCRSLNFFETTPVVERDLANGAGATRVLMRRSEKCPATNSARPSDGPRNRRARDGRGQSAFSPRRFLINALWLAQRGSRTAKCDKLEHDATHAATWGFVLRARLQRGIP